MSNNRRGKPSRSTSDRRPRKRDEAGKFNERPAESTVQFGNAGYTTRVSKLSPTRVHLPSQLGYGTAAAGQYNNIDTINQVLTESKGLTWHSDVSFQAHSLRSPNVMRLDVQNLFGSMRKTNNDATGIYRAALSLMQVVAARYGQAPDYRPQDLAAYFMAVVDCYNLAAEIRRDIKILQIPSEIAPAFIPRNMFAALGICAPSDMSEVGWKEPSAESGYTWYRSHITEITNRLNIELSLLGTLPIPQQLEVAGYNDDIYSFLYKDSDVQEGYQTYVFASTGSWIFNEDIAEAGSSVAYYEWPWNTDDINATNRRQWKTLDQMVDRLHVMLEALTVQSTDMSVMVNNVSRTFEGALQRPALLDLNAEPFADIIYDELMLESINNATILDQIWAGGFLADADSDRLEGLPYMVDSPDTVVQTYGTINLPLQFNKDISAVTQDDIGAALRFHPRFNIRTAMRVFDRYNPNGVSKHVITSDGCFGFALITGLGVFSLDRWGNLERTRFTNRVDSGANANLLMVFADFAYAPLLINADVQKKTDESSRVTWTVDVRGYSAARTTEFTLDYAVERDYWAGLTSDMWGVNSNLQPAAYGYNS